MTNNHILRMVQYLCYEYWKDYTEMADYFLLNDFRAFVLDRYPAEWKAIIPAGNSTYNIFCY